jgi:hypothetical protein
MGGAWPAMGGPFLRPPASPMPRLGPAVQQPRGRPAGRPPRGPCPGPGRARARGATRLEARAHRPALEGAPRAARSCSDSDGASCLGPDAGAGLGRLKTVGGRLSGGREGARLILSALTCTSAKATPLNLNDRMSCCKRQLRPSLQHEALTQSTACPARPRPRFLLTRPGPITSTHALDAINCNMCRKS